MSGKRDQMPLLIFGPRLRRREIGQRWRLGIGRRLSWLGEVDDRLAVGLHLHSPLFFDKLSVAAPLGFDRVRVLLRWIKLW